MRLLFARLLVCRLNELLPRFCFFQIPPRSRILASRPLPCLIDFDLKKVFSLNLNELLPGLFFLQPSKISPSCLCFWVSLLPNDFDFQKIVAASLLFWTPKRSCLYLSKQQRQRSSGWANNYILLLLKWWHISPRRQKIAKRWVKYGG